MNIQNLKVKVDAIFPEIVEIRRDIHMHPEIGWDVERTAGIAAKEMRKLGLEVREQVGKSGVVADLNIPGASGRIALRADMDALPIQELNDLPYRSKRDGFSHMCGHDSHTAMLIGAARLLTEMRETLQANIRFIFQPNEENLPGGAPLMIEDGVLDGVNEIFGLHVWPSQPTGSVGVCSGPALGQPDVFEIEIIGSGGHAAMPHLTVDPIIIAAQFINAAQSIVSRNTNPLESAVVSITQVHAGTAHNVIPKTASIMGTVRTFNPEIQKMIRAKIASLMDSLAQGQGAEFKLNYTEGYPVTYNHPESSETVRQLAENLVEPEKLIFPAKPTLGGEDFAYYTQRIPGSFLFIGSGNPEKGCIYSLHDPRFQLDEDAMRTGIAMHVLLAQNAKF